MSETYDDINDTDENDGIVTSNGAGRVYKWGKHAIELDRLPANVVDEALRRAFNHVMSNEAKSKSGTVSKKMIAEGDLDSEPSAIKTMRDELEDTYRESYIASMYDGTWGTRRGGGTSGPRLDSLETEFNRILASTVKEGLNKHPNIRFDKEAKVWFWLLGDGSKETRTLEQAMENWVSVEGRRETLMAQAQKAVDFKKQQAEAKAAVKAAPTEAIQF